MAHFVEFRAEEWVFVDLFFVFYSKFLKLLLKLFNLSLHTRNRACFHLFTQFLHALLEQCLALHTSNTGTTVHCFYI